MYDKSKLFHCISKHFYTVSDMIANTSGYNGVKFGEL